MHQPVAVLIHYRARPGSEDAAGSALAGLIEKVVRLESACISIDLCRDAENPGSFMLYEIWTDKAAYTGEHMRTPHIQAFIARAGTMFVGPPDITFWNPVRRIAGTSER